MTPLKNSQERWLETALEEYKALREEVLAQFLNRNQILTFGSAILGGLIVSLKDQYSGHFLRQRLKPAFHRWRFKIVRTVER